MVATCPAFGVKDYIIEIGHGHMSPDHLLLEAEDRIVFKNVVHMEGGHSIVVSDEQQLASSPALEKDGQWVYQFNDPGSFTLTLKEHPVVTAKVTVFTEDVMKAAITDLRKEMVSYSIGFDFGEKVVKKLDNLDLKLFIAGMQHAYNDEDPMLNEEEMAFIIVDYKRQVEQKAKSRFENLAAFNLTRSKEFLATNQAETDIFETESGLQYKILKEGHGRKPIMGDRVRVHYRGTFTNQVEFDNTYTGDVSEFTLTAQVLPGIIEGLTLMPEGAKLRLFVPPHLGYGRAGQPNLENERLSIEPNAILIFEIELFEVVGASLISENSEVNGIPVDER